MKHSGLVDRTRAILFSTAIRFGFIGDAFFPANQLAFVRVAAVCRGGSIFPAVRGALSVKETGRARSVFPYPQNVTRVATVEHRFPICAPSGFQTR